LRGVAVTESTVPGLEAALAPEFELLRPLGSGAMASVFLGREVALRRLVAIKVPRPELAGDATIRARFEREARAAARLRHPGIAGIHRIARLDDGTPFLVMEYVDGPTLADRLRADGPLPRGEAIDLLRQVAEALAEAHDRGVIHRDVRPGNVLLADHDRRAVLTDFGIAGILDTGAEAVTRITRPGELLGDPAYRSPEQLLGDPVTSAADSYGWGLIAYEVLTGQLPFSAATPDAMALAHLRLPPRALADLDPDLDPELAGLVERCLAKDPRHRPSARSLAALTARYQDRAAHDAAIGTVGQIPALAGFLGELRRRRVYNVAIGYAAGAFVLLQVAELILQGLPVPEWVYPLVVAITLSGFPVALVLAWMYDLTAAGVRRAESAASTTPGPLYWVLPALGLLFSLLFAGLIGWWVLSG
jgi:tRNA A-37 threonylcarbamoyl transferase component Bud32